MKIPFDITKRPQIESGEFKVETRDGKPVRIICWNRVHAEYPIVALVSLHNEEVPLEYANDGCFYFDKVQSKDDLFLITPEEELTPFEDALQKKIAYVTNTVVDDDSVKEWASELLTLALKELKPEIDAEIAKAYMNADEVVFRKGVEHGKAEAVEKFKQSWFNEGKIEGRYEGLTEDEKYQQGVHDGKEEALKEIIKSLFPLETDILTLDDLYTAIQKNGVGCYKHGFEEGKKVALKDLPRWIPNRFDKQNFETCKAYLDTPRYLCYQNKMIDVSELVEKLPGFKED